MNADDSTDFGFTRVPKNEKTKRVGRVFHSVAGRYDLMNDLMSLGVHRLWKRFVIEMAHLRAGQRVLDLAGGTGDLTMMLAKRVGPTGQVLLGDINGSMLKVGRERLLDNGIIIEHVQMNAEHLPLQSHSLDLITMAFGLRNVTDKTQALREMQRVLKPGGQLLVLEFSELRIPPLKPLYDAYSFHVLPALGKLFANDADSYRYLAESIRMHPNQDMLLDIMQTAGFERCDYHNLNGGIVAVHRGYKL